VLALQGDFAEHIKMLEQCGASAIAVRYAEELDLIHGLIIPGGESTAVAKLTDEGTAPIFSAIKAKIAPSEKIGALLLLLVIQCLFMARAWVQFFLPKRLKVLARGA
jgi:glutamine amidotransferase PdxT